MRELTYLMQMTRGEQRKNNDVSVDDAYANAAQQGATFYLSEQKTAAHLEKGAQLWAELISATGGVIAHHKSVWQMLSWQDHTTPQP